MRSKSQRATNIIRELVNEFKLTILLDMMNLARATYYYQLKRQVQKDKDSELNALIKGICTKPKGRYGYRRIHLELRNRSYQINHKKVQRLISELGLKARIRVKRRYNSYKGEVSKKADNLIQRFKTT